MKLGAWIGLSFAFAGICVSADWVMTHVVIYGNENSDAGRIHHLYVENGDETPIFGSSRARNDYIPAEIGFNSFNYGFDGACVDVMEVLLQIELSKHKTTPIIIDMQIAENPDIGGELNYVPYITDPRFRHLFQRHDRMVWRYYLPGIRYFNSFDWHLRPFINQRISTMQKTTRGYTHEFRVDRVEQDAFDQMVKLRMQSSYGFHPDDAEDERLVADFAAHPERLFFLVYSPYHPSCFAHFENADKFAAFKKKLALLPNVTVFDWCRLDYPEDYFRDTTHLQEKGAIVFSRKLKDAISEELRKRGRLAANNVPTKNK